MIRWAEAASASLLAGFARLLTGVRAIWKQSPEASGRRIYYANHSSHGDFVLVWASLPAARRRRTRPVAGADYWLGGPVRRFVGCRVFRAVLIERERAASHRDRSADPIGRMAAALDDGDDLILFPEGTRNMGDQPLLPFKSGLFHLAKRRPETELVPVWLANLNRVLPKGQVLPVPLLCTATFGPALTLAPGEGKDAFLARAREALLELAPEEL
jgi:1-acyl-sn-glycerol-3-phosphate acyltransferase